jgi:hypothetical protein
MTAQPIQSSNLPDPSTEQLATYFNVPVKNISILKLRDNTIAVMYYNQYDTVDSTRAGLNFFLKIIEIDNSQLKTIASIDRNPFPYGGDYEFDPTLYRLNRKEYLFGLRYQVYPSKHPYPWLTLLRITGTEIRLFAILCG